MNEYTKALTELSQKEMHPANMILAVIVGIAWLIYSNSPQY